MVIDIQSQQSPFKQLIDLIHEFPFSLNFLLWISDKKLEAHNTFLKKQNGKFDDKFEGVTEISSEGIRIYSAGWEISFKVLSKDFLDIIEMDEKEYYRLNPEIARLNKKMVSNNWTDKTYTILSQFISQDQVCGCIWEIYYLEKLFEIYQKKLKHIKHRN